jgi:hypothetical protein
MKICRTTFDLQLALKCRMFVGALEGTVPVVTTGNMQDLLSLCSEFGFSGLHSQVTDFISAHSVAEDGARKATSEVTEDKLQIRQALCPLQGAVSRLARDNGEIEQSLSLLRKDAMGLREAHARKNADLEKGQAESSERLVSYEKEQEALKREIAVLREAHARLDREVAEFRAQLAQEVRLLREALHGAFGRGFIIADDSNVRC